VSVSVSDVIELGDTSDDDAAANGNRKNNVDVGNSAVNGGNGGSSPHSDSNDIGRSNDVVFLGDSDDDDARE